MINSQGGGALGKFVSGAKVLAAVPSISQRRRVYPELHKKKERLNGKELSTKTEIQSDEECFSGMVNRNLILSHFCTIHSLVSLYVVTVRLIGYRKGRAKANRVSTSFTSVSS